MTVWEHWQPQREQLRPTLLYQQDLSGVSGQVRHALLQTEQNLLAQLPDDIIRQQAGILMGCIKNSIGLLEAHGAAQVWVPQKQEKRQTPSLLWLFAACCMLAVCLWCVLTAHWLLFAALVSGLIVALAAYLQERKSRLSMTEQDETHITIKPDIDNLLMLIDGQVRSLDRYLNDFSYLNEQLQGASECTDPLAVARAAELLEALYERDEAERGQAGEAARKLLESLGLQAIDYSQRTSRLFNALPSKNTTCTLCPAIVSIKEQRLLRRGTAVVHMDVA